MTDINLKTLTPDTSLPTTGFLFGADSQSSTNPSVYSTQTVATTLLGSTSLTGDVLTADAPVLNLAQTWNNGAVTFTGIRYNATSTASAAASLLMDLQVGAASKFKVDKNSRISTGLAEDIGLLLTSSRNGQLEVQRGSSTRAAIGVDGVFTTSQNGFFWSNAGTDLNTTDLFLTRKAAANLRFGAADAATPVAQTLSVQSVVAGTTDGAGQPFTFTGSQSTGTGVPGNILIQTASSAATTGSAQNSLATVATFGPSTLRLAQTTPALDLAQTWNTSGNATALKLNVTNTASGGSSLLMDLQAGGVSQFSIYPNGFFTCRQGADVATAGGNFTLKNDGSAFILGTGYDAIIGRKAAANFRFGNANTVSPVAQTLSVQSIVAGQTNASAAAYPFTITGAQGTGSGAGGSIIFQTAAANAGGGATVQNTLTDTLTLDSVGSVRVVRALTVATLPGAPLAGMIARVSDANTPVIGTTVAAGGAAYALVNYNGANWTVIGV